MYLFIYRYINSAYVLFPMIFIYYSKYLLGETMPSLACFKAYDVRGRVPETLNPAIARAVGIAFAQVCGAHNVVIGRDARLSGAALRDALVLGLREGGAAVTDIGLCGTEEIYYAAFAKAFDGGIMITGSHNPADENGFKMVRAGAVPLSGDSGLNSIAERTASLLETLPQQPISVQLPPLKQACYRADYVQHCLNFVGCDGLAPLKIHVDAGNGCAGLVLRELMPLLPYTFSCAHMEPDGHFPDGVPNPLLPEKRAATARAVRENKADMGIAWDGDFDRCFFYDSEGNFIEGYYLVGLLGQAMLERVPGAKIIHDPRLVWNTEAMVRKAGGTPVLSKTGHAFIKERMRAEDAVYGGEMSAHHYFRDFAYCDSGMLPWLLVARLMSYTGKTLSALVAECMAAYPCSGEINRHVPNAAAIMQHIKQQYSPCAISVVHVDGLSMAFADAQGMWRFNLRCSNTEPLLRLNVEAKGDSALMQAKTTEILAYIDAFSAV
jgi:phosphomannomutase